jgi:hypothetical protein
MVSVDGSIDEPTPTGVVADRVDVYRIAAAELKRAGHISPQPDDVLGLAKFFEWGADFV